MKSTEKLQQYKVGKTGCIGDGRKYFFSHRVVGPGIVWIKKWWMHLVSMLQGGT